MKVKHILSWLLIHAFCALAINPTKLSMRVTITILGITFGFGASAFELFFSFD